MPGRVSARLRTFAAIFARKRYMAIAAAGALLFYYLFYYLVSAENYGAFILLMSPYLLYALVVTSGILFAISVFAVANSLASRRMGIEGGIIGVLMPSIGGVVASCACTFPIIASVLLFFGVNTLEAAGIISLVNSYQLWIMLAMIAANLAIIYYYLGRLGISKKRRR